MNSHPKQILVFGSTGKQGGAVVKALAVLNSGIRHPKYEILAVTRDSNSPKAVHLAAIANVKIIQGDINNAEVLFQENDRIWGVFLVGNTKVIDEEIAQGKSISDLCVKYRVNHVVYSSVDLGSMEDTGVPNFESKREVEKYIKSLTALTYTILGPNFFMDNLSTFNPASSFMGRVMFTAILHHTFLNSATNRTIKMQSVKDIGGFAAKVFDSVARGEENYIGRKIALVGDELTPEEFKKVYKEVTGKEVALTWGIFGWLMTRIVPIFKHMANGPGMGSLKEFRDEFPEAQDFHSFLLETK